MALLLGAVGHRGLAAAEQPRKHLAARVLLLAPSANQVGRAGLEEMPAAGQARPQLLGRILQGELVRHRGEHRQRGQVVPLVPAVLLDEGQPHAQEEGRGRDRFNVLDDRARGWARSAASPAAAPASPSAK